jgi:STE24 endopeptidase
LSIAVGTVQSLIVFSLFYLMVRRFRKTWWIWSSAGVVVVFLTFFVLQLFLVEPLFNTYKPAPPGVVRDTVVAMAKQVGMPSDKILIYDGSKQSNRYTANAGGFLGFGRVAMSDVMFKKDADLAEVKGVVGHEMGHYVHGHVPLAAVEYGVLALAAFFLLDRLFPWFARALGARGVTGLADPAGLPVVSIIFAIMALVATPLTTSLSRWSEADADRFSVEHFNEPDGLAKALVKTIEYRAATPSALEEFLFYDHPAVGRRVRAAMDWKASHPPSTPPTPAQAGAQAAPAAPPKS